MANVFEPVRHPRLDERQAEGPAKVADMRPLDHPKFWVRFNARVGLLITLGVGTMWCAYVFAVIALLSLPSTLSSGSLFMIVVWISSSFLQLVLLPIIIVGQNISGQGR
jgi:hypothetical protein